ncbi:hypothetical protein DUNSADRAFT_10943 [Dunaliella salina]|uniref:Encoded protein n=1 Tax=Dunaliella salina TaxID=3046 RepID=A0ABQ7GEF1_DUNSA|nr:hypothetical protein DUNSADRAFT_10943 [Dunaliella salina]|eukprot:KAF5832987.1 hypothetical protein DUNSADRAFT_10943 [Dunaliella salina]
MPHTRGCAPGVCPAGHQVYAQQSTSPAQHQVYAQLRTSPAPGLCPAEHQMYAQLNTRFKCSQAPGVHEAKRHVAPCRVAPRGMGSQVQLNASHKCISLQMHHTNAFHKGDAGNPSLHKSRDAWPPAPVHRVRTHFQHVQVRALRNARALHKTVT